MSNNKLLNTSVDLKQKLMTQAFNYYQNVIFKNPLKVKKFETQKSEENWLKYEILYYKVQQNELTIKENIDNFLSLKGYIEENDYLIELRNIILAQGFSITAQEIRFAKDNTVLALSNFNDLSLDFSVRSTADKIFRNEADYMYSTVSPRYYTEIENFYFLFDLILKFRSSIKLYTEMIDESLNINTIDPYILNNFFLSNGFSLGLDIPPHLKANFALSLFKMYETKGTYTSFFEIFKALNVRYPIYSIYLLRMKNELKKDEFRAIKIPVATSDANPYDYLKRILNTYKGEDLNNILRNISVTNEELVSLDPKWGTNLTELLDLTDGLQIIKTNYHFIEVSRNLKEVTLLWSLADIISRYIKEDIVLSTSKIEQVNLKQIIALLNSLVFKALDVSTNVEQFVSQRELNRVASYYSLEEIKEKASKIKNVNDLANFFKEAKSVIKLKTAYNVNKYYYDPDLNILDIPAETQIEYKDLLGAVDMFNDLVAITSSTITLEFFDELIYSLDDLFYQINLPSTTTQLLPIEKLLNYFKTFYSTIITYRTEAQKFNEFNYGYRPARILGVLDYSNIENESYEPIYFKENPDEFLVNYFFSGDPAKWINRNYRDISFRKIRYDFLEKINGLMKYNREILQNDVTFIIDLAISLNIENYFVDQFYIAGLFNDSEKNPSSFMNTNPENTFARYFNNNLQYERFEIHRDTISYQAFDEFDDPTVLPFKEEMLNDSQKYLKDIHGDYILDENDEKIVVNVDIDNFIGQQLLYYL